jgi:hypothetical protein
MKQLKTAGSALQAGALILVKYKKLTYFEYGIGTMHAGSM